MEKINPNLITRIRNRLSADNEAYIKIKLDISKTFFAISASLYFFCYLSTLAGFEVEFFGKILVGIYPVFLFSIFALIYDLLIYSISNNSEKAGSYKIPILVTLGLLYCILLVIFLGLKF